MILARLVTQESRVQRRVASSCYPHWATNVTALLKSVTATDEARQQPERQKRMLTAVNAMNQAAASDFLIRPGSAQVLFRQHSSGSFRG